MNNTLSSLLAGLVSGAITAVVTYYATLAKARLDLSIEYDKELHSNRLTAYKELWPRLKPLARYSVERPITYQVVKDTSEKMRDWYFDVGGIFLSRASRKPYFALKDEMQKIIDDEALQKEPGKALGKKRLQSIHDFSRDLREALSNDVGTRERRFLDQVA
jgi:hypothetical protein